MRRVGTLIIDVISLFAGVVFAFAQPGGRRRPLARLFFGALIGLAAAIGLLGLLLRALSAPAP